MAISQDVDAEREYMWITWHPFSQSKWANLKSPDEIREAVKAHPEVLNGADIDEDIVRKVAESLWLILLPDRERYSEPSRIE